MKMHLKRQHIKNLMLPVAMIGGAVFYKWMDALSFLSPYLIFLMLFITYCKMNLSEVRPHRMHLQLIMSQMILAGLVYVILLPADHTLAEGVFICVFIPTATAAPVITSMLGGSISFVVTYSLLSNACVAILGPVILAIIGDNTTIGLGASAWLICTKVFPLLIFPLVAALILRGISTRLHGYVQSHQQISFYLWAVSLFIIVGSCISFTIKNWKPSGTWTTVFLALGALIVCLLQFYIGRKIGAWHKDAVSGGQSLGQKNTVLAVWLAMAYMNPLASVAPAAYIAWQNIINSWQLINKHKYGNQRDDR